MTNRYSLKEKIGLAGIYIGSVVGAGYAFYGAIREITHPIERPLVVERVEKLERDLGTLGVYDVNSSRLSEGTIQRRMQKINRISELVQAREEIVSSEEYKKENGKYEELKLKRSSTDIGFIFPSVALSIGSLFYLLCVRGAGKKDENKK